MRKLNYFFVFIVLICLTLFLVVNYLTPTNAKIKKSSNKIISVNVEAQKAKKKYIEETLSLTGEFFANETVNLQSEISGRIVFIGFDDGQLVKKGDLLIGLDDSIPEAEFFKDTAEYNLAKSNLKRSLDLHQKNYLSERALEEIITAEEKAKAKMQLARAILDQYKIKAPFDGKIGLRKFSVGTYVKNGQELMTLQDLKILKFDFEVPERYSNMVSIGQSLLISTNTLDQNIVSKVDAIDVANKNRGRVLFVRALVDNSEGILRSGMFGKAELIVKKKEKAVVIPESALFSEQSNKFVWKIQNGIVKKTRILTGIRLKDEVEILSGLTSGDRIVTAGHLKLRKDGQSVTIIDKN